MRVLHSVAFRLAGISLLLASAQAGAFDWDIGDDLSLTWNNRLTAGVDLRMQNRNLGLIGKENVPGQMNLCTVDNCISLSNDPSLNQRLVDAPGAFSGVNGDDGDLNYDKYDIVSAPFKLTTDLKLKWGEHWLARMRAIGFYDPVNANFDEKHTDTRYQDATSKRPDSIARKFAKGVNLYDAYVQYAFDFPGGRSAAFSVGSQTVRWGESTLIAVNSLSEVNPPNEAILRMPGYEISELFQPVPVVLLSSDIMENVSGEILYQFGWKEVTPDPRGSFFADNDLIAPPGTPAYITLGQFGEDPFRRAKLGKPLGALSSTTNTVYLGEPSTPSDGGQYGLRLNYFADWLNGGTETSFYFLNYHSRLPYGTVEATDDSCTRDDTNFATSFLHCNGYNGTLPHVPGLVGKEPLPIDTLAVHLDYPENIQMYGFSFNTNIGSFSLAGEYAFRPNLPVQVNLTDVIFAGLQPAFPAQGFAIDPTGLAQGVQLIAGSLGLSTSELAAQFPGLAGDVLLLAQSSFPGANQAVPSYLAAYRNLGRINAHQRIQGYERLPVGQFDFTAIKAFSENPLGADQIIEIAEVGGTQVFNMPKRDQLQFEGAGLYRTHYSPGADGSGNGGVAPYPTTLNPHQQTTGFADSFSWGIRSITRLEYNDVIFGWSFLPTITLAWDVKGIAPAPFGSFVEGRKEITVGTDINITQFFSARGAYQWFTGGGLDNTRRDRDNLAFSLAYTF